MTAKDKARYVMIGGFLGAGKTTAILKLAAYLKSKGKRVGLITNDQSIDLVDTARVNAAGFPVEEITGGCFCCKFNSLVDASSALTQKTAPDVFIAEPVGSCTDLKATVSYPLRKLYADNYRVAPLSVFVDPNRCAKVLGVSSEGGQFSKKVVYVYRKQLEEAEILVINKIDSVSPELRQKLAAALKENFPQAEAFEVSSKTGEGLEKLWERLVGGDLGNQKPMEVDYDTYAEGEALLGWLNATVSLSASADFDGNSLIMSLARRLRDRLATSKIEIAHLKMTLVPDEGRDMASLSLTATAGDPEPTHTLKEPLSAGRLLINLRAEVEPEFLKTEVTQAIAALGPVKGEIKEIAAFRPGRPTPTHRMAVAV